MRRMNCALLVCLGLAVCDARAELNVYDGFSYPVASSLNGQAGGIGFTGGWADSPAIINSGNLSFGSLLTSGNSVFAPSPGEVLNRTLVSALGTAGETVYLGFLVQSPLPGPVDTNTSYGLGLLGSKGNLFIGKPSAPPATSQYVIENFDGPGQVSSGVNAIAGVTAFLVVRADFTAGNDTFRLYVNPPVGGVEPSTADAIKSDFDFGTIDAVQINGSASFYFDELRIGSTYADVVVPEPASVLWVTFASALLTRPRARRAP